MAQQIISLIWQDIPFTVTVKPNYFTYARMAHVEIHCERSLPITETGYKSIFIPQDELHDADTLCADILQHMTETARDIGWIRHKQMSLFDL